MSRLAAIFTIIAMITSFLRFFGVERMSATIFAFVTGFLLVLTFIVTAGELLTRNRRT